MGDIARTRLLDAYVAEFGEELLDLYRVYGDWVVEQEIGADDEGFVRLHVVVRESTGDEQVLLSTRIFFDPSMCEEDAHDAIDLYVGGMRPHEDADTWERRVEALRGRIKKVFE